MSVQYLSNEKGQITAVQVPIEEWERLKIALPDIEDIDTSLPQWQKDLIDRRLKDIQDHPELLRPIEELYDLLDKDDDQ